MTKKVLVLMGGFSSEKGVSLVSGKTAYEALKTAGYEVEAVDVTREVDRQIRNSFGGQGPDVVFNALHGPFGEDGTVQGMLEMMGIPYTHSGCLTSALCMDKDKTKEILDAAGLRVPQGRVVRTDELVGKHPMPVPYVLKPVAEGSTFGVVIVREESEPAPRPDLLMDEVYHGRAIIETYIPGHELTVALKGDEPLAVTEIKAEFYDYEAKYSSNAAPHVIPAEIPGEITTEALIMAQRAGQVLGCRGLSRVDFRWNPELGVNGLFILEVNTQPGMTPTSLASEQAAHRGISFAELCQWMVEDASCRR
ncbi:D-alanine--D-alanine ligase [Parvularcula lutaonensis]|uniref:D-alanine--D-alanine ligase n=1 Tax=Parvularcula lutaonensis TaxID=491923 RepID=A0ABV7M8U6_9PROT|nr:D-alanine--D-alanine ligase [Parvularcula lutaonensis]GGY41591.1 D-alanine--D-alanine ligase [Parvularcula lutaonensis]